MRILMWLQAPMTFAVFLLLPMFNVQYKCTLQSRVVRMPVTYVHALSQADPTLKQADMILVNCHVTSSLVLHC